ncbi:histone deacetylase 6 [Gigaspora margarita]|uniref:Histone deacetylase 6 n=1 Tax=Gigaspora margarita TaxID=4874 RepID=A0A8H4ENE0_GIGMA|nr:histone deacetylase 6 [Gigaspora margarita]
MHTVTPKTDCPHINNELTHAWAQVPVDVGAPCNTCQNTSENWRCLECQKVFCSRYVNGHMKEHNEQTNHKLTISFSDISTWCYECDDYVINPILNQIKSSVHFAKFGTLPPDAHGIEVVGEGDNAGEGSSSS